MVEQTLAEKEGAEIAAMVDNVCDMLERQLDPDDVVGRSMLSQLKADVRRRLVGQPVSVEEKFLSTPITVEVEKMDLTEVIPPGSFNAHFHGTPYLVTVVRTVEHGNQTITHGFFLAAEADCFLTGLKAARAFGLPFKEIPDIKDISDEKIFTSAGGE